MRIKLLAVLFFCALSLPAQTFTLGLPTDPCSGGAPLVITGTTNTVRWGQPKTAGNLTAPGDFSCTFQVPDGLYTVQLGFYEPCFAAGACGAGRVLDLGGQRSQNLFINDIPVLSGFVPYFSGATDSLSAFRKALVYSANGMIVVRLQTVLRSSVLASVTITPFTAGMSAQIVRQQCVGSGLVAGQAFNCAGIEVWGVTVAGITRNFAVTAAPDEMISLPVCPSQGAVCLQPAALGDPSLRLTADYNEPPMSINGFALIPWNQAGVCPWLPNHCFGTTGLQ